MAATHVALQPADDEAPDYDGIARRLFAGNVLIGLRSATVRRSP